MPCGQTHCGIGSAWGWGLRGAFLEEGNLGWALKGERERAGHEGCSEGWGEARGQRCRSRSSRGMSKEQRNSWGRSLKCGGQNGTEERGAEEALSLQVGDDRRGVSRALHPGNPTSI